MYNLIFTKHEMLLSRKTYSHWREIQDDYEDYKASLDFESLEAVIDYIVFDYSITQQQLRIQLKQLEKEETIIIHID